MFVCKSPCSLFLGWLIIVTKTIVNFCMFVSCIYFCNKVLNACLYAPFSAACLPSAANGVQWALPQNKNHGTPWEFFPYRGGGSQFPKPL